MRIEYTETARKQLKKLDKTIQKRVYRVGDCRVICEIQESRIIISVLKIGHRKNIY